MVNVNTPEKPAPNEPPTASPAPYFANWYIVIGICMVRKMYKNALNASMNFFLYIDDSKLLVIMGINRNGANSLMPFM